MRFNSEEFKNIDEIKEEVLSLGYQRAELTGVEDCYSKDSAEGETDLFALVSIDGVEYFLSQV